MKIVLATVGTTGDVLPYVALGRALKARGHQVLACAADIHRAHFEKHQLEFRAAGAPFSMEDFNRTLEAIARLNQPFKQFELLAERVFLAAPEKQFADHLEASRGADLVVAHWFDYLAQEAAIKNGVRWAAVTLMPEIFRTAEAPVFPYPRLGKWWIKLTWDQVEEMAAPLAARVRALLARFGGAPRPMAIAGALSPHLNLLAVSRHLIEVRGDWPSNLVVTGSWFNEEPEYQPPPQLAEFFAKYPKPIAVTFGSMGGHDAVATTALIDEALAKLGYPAIVQRGYGGLAPRARENLFVADYVPHDYLFARSGCVVHHAGGGTAAAVARSGAPSVPVPHLFDQYYWAGMLHRRGVATRPIFRNQLKAKALASNLKDALGSASMKTRAAELARQVAAERGVERAVEALLQLGA